MGALFVISSLRTIFILTGLLFTMTTQASAAVKSEIVCVQCHGSQTGRFAKPVELWRGSIHAENGINCNHCHGGDPGDAENAMSPARGFLGTPVETGIPGFCGRCHVGVLKDYLGSKHGKNLGKGGPTCITCHGSHQVKKTTIELINEKNCSRCHSYEKPSQIKRAMTATEAKIVYIDSRLSDFKGKGIDTSAMEKSLFAVRNRFHTLFHELNVARINLQTAEIDKELEQQLQSIKRLDETEQKRKLVGVMAIASALLAALVLRLYVKSMD
ncbi:cytochrome c3 family protein [Geobacter pelophilus]|uniref:Cytochrome c3 family protein n=2 Tax=Geoanaerobacter pelophilus TaxID=60036 RepID=A0AAW4LAM2_9BACT|nr:cytochrome c3 family protein [Geoanaerobacter pelophilus]